MKVLNYPLDIHKGAREMCIAVICDKKGFDDLEGQYTSGNQCAEGAKIVDETISFLKGKGIGGTPTYIFADGRPHSGVLDEAGLRQKAKVGK